MSFFKPLIGWTARRAIFTSLVLAAVTLTASNAFAVSLRVKLACASDYYAHCSAYSPDSPQVRSCMRTVGRNLSKGCVSALVAAGEVSAAEVTRHRRATRTAAK
jgi:hypothetical protein